MIYLLKIKRWRLLLIMFLPAIISGILEPENTGVYSLFGSCWVSFVYFLWIDSMGAVLGGRNIIGILTGVFLTLILCSGYMQYFVDEVGKLNFSYWFISSCLLAIVIYFCLLYFVTGVFIRFRRSKGELDVNFILTFIYFWFFPIGICFLQPKLNEWMGAKESCQANF